MPTFAPPDLIARVRQAAKDSGWPTAKCNTMFKNLFAVTKESGGLAALTVTQAEDCLRLFQSAKQGDAEFDALVLGLHAEGRVAIGKGLP